MSQNLLQIQWASKGNSVLKGKSSVKNNNFTYYQQYSTLRIERMYNYTETILYCVCVELFFVCYFVKTEWPYFR